MAQFRKHSAASAIALAIGLSACGGGGGGHLSPTPFIPSPTTPSPASPSIGPAGAPRAPNASQFPQATAGGPTMNAHPETAFPLVQSVYTLNGSSAAANTAATNGGATLTFDYPGASQSDTIGLAVPGLGLDLDLVAGGGWYCYTYCGSQGDRYADMDFATPAGSNLDWTTYGFWYSSTPNNASQSYAAYVTGYATTPGSVPTTGTATYNASAQAHVFYPSIQGQNGIGHDFVSGNASLQANFGTRSITGSLTNMVAGSAPWNSVSLLGAISGGNFSGTTAVSSAPGGPASLSGSASGTFAGLFFGPSAQELGAVWTLSDGSRTAVGTIGARSGP